MAVGAGNYDDLASVARIQSDAQGVVLLVFNGSKGSGFSAQLPKGSMADVPRVLREVADAIDADLKELGKTAG